jgi:hypothetical protein
MKKITLNHPQKTPDQSDLLLYLTHTLIVDEKDWEHIRKLMSPKTKKAKA